MLSIRAMREDRAAGDLTRARRARAEAERARDEKRKTRLKFEETKEERRDRIFETVIGRAVSREDLDRTREAVRAIDEEGLLLLEDERKAETTVEERTKQAQEAHAQYIVAEKNKEKIVIHKGIWEEEDRLERERAEDLELEEFTGRREESDDD